MRTPWTALALLAAGCMPGRLDWRGDAEPLRSALYAVEPTERLDAAGRPEAYRVGLILSTGYLECDPVELGENWEISEARFYTALTYEGARHLYIELFRSSEVPWTGTYPGSERVGFDQLYTEDHNGRVSSGWFLSVDEAVSAEEDGLISVYQPTEVSLGLLQTGGWLDIDSWSEDDDTFRASFSLPDVDLSGTIRAPTRCDADSTAFRVFSSCDPDVIEQAVAEALANDEELPDFASLCGDVSFGTFD